MFPSLTQLLIVLVLVLVLFGAGKLPRVMGDLGKGMRAFRDGMKSDEEERITHRKDDKDA